VTALIRRSRLQPIPPSRRPYSMRQSLRRPTAKIVFSGDPVVGGHASRDSSERLRRVRLTPRRGPSKTTSARARAPSFVAAAHAYAGPGPRDGGFCGPPLPPPSSSVNEPGEASALKSSAGTSIREQKNQATASSMRTSGRTRRKRNGAPARLLSLGRPRDRHAKPSK
jgi:hypothetical protein